LGALFSASEIFEIAEQIERNGAVFYEKAAEIADGEKIKDLLQILSEWERKHEALFASMRAELSPEEKGGDRFQPSKEITAYLHAIANGRVFNVKEDPAEVLSGTEKTEDILRMAVGREKDAIVFYTGIREAVSEELGKGKVDDIIKEEMRHITILGEYLYAD
jgi:rubrerythrin